MKKIYNFLLCILAMTSLTFAQSPNTPNEGLRFGYNSNTNAFTLSWWGRSNRNYFIQQTDDLKNWVYLPIMNSGSNQVIQLGVTSSSIKSFFRLQFDNDLNSLPDAWEQAYYGHSGINPNALSSRGDGLSILQSFQQGLNPNDIYNVSPVTILPVVNLTTSATSTLTAPANVTLTASASESNGTIARVDFYQEGGYIGSAYSYPYNFPLNNLIAGGYTVSAVAVDGVGVSASSNNATFTILPPLTTSTSTRYTRGTSVDPFFNSYITAVNFEQGILLDATGNNFSKFPSANNDVTKLPWFLRIQKNTAYHINVAGSPSSPQVSYLPFENPLVAFGAEGGGSALYTGQSYSFEVSTGGRYVPDINDLLINVYSKASLVSGQTNVASILPLTSGSIRLTLPKQGTTGWNTFEQNGYVQTKPVTDGNGNILFNVSVQYKPVYSISVSGTLIDFSPMLVTVSSNTSDYYLKISSMGRTYLSVYNWIGWMAVDNLPGNPGDCSINFTMDFQQRPPWRAVYIDQPQFQGVPIPSIYQGKSLSELLNNAQPVVDTISPPTSGTLLDIDTSPELRQHPILDNFVNSMGNSSDQTSWALALSNYVLNEIELTDAISYSDSGNISDQSINPGGVNRGALATFTEGQGSPAEQCALLIYCLRKAQVPCGYIFPQHNGVLMLDQQLSKLLRMQLKGAVDTLGSSNVPQLIPTNYPWVAAYIGGKWIHIFPWLKDTSVVEGQDVWQYLPINYQTGRQWLNKYLLDDLAIRSLSTEYDNPGNLFPLFIKNSLATNYQNVSIDQLGVNIYNRRNYFTSWSDFPRPWQTPQVGNANLTDNLSIVPNIFDTMTVQIYKQNGATPIMSTAPMRMVDLHNRRFLLYSVQNGTTNSHTLNLSLEAFRPNPPGVSGSFSSTDTFLNSQNQNVLLTATDDTLSFAIDYKRHRSLTATPSVNQWPSLGVQDILEVTGTRPLRKGDMGAFVMNYGRVTSAMLDVHAQKYQALQQLILSNSASNITTPIDPEIAQGIPAYMMGISYYYNLSKSNQQFLNLTKSNVTSFFGYGFSQLGANRDLNGNITSNGQLGKISLIYPKIDMCFQYTAIANNATLHPNMGSETLINIENDYLPLFAAESSAQEHRTINNFFQKNDSISTVKLLDIVQKSGSNIVQMDSTNYNISSGSSPWNNSYYYSGTTQSLALWAGYKTTGAQNPNSLYSLIVNGINSATYPTYQRVFITPGPVVGASGAYIGVGAFVSGINQNAGYITSNLNVMNGGYGGFNLFPITSTPDSLNSWSLMSSNSGYIFGSNFNSSSLTLSYIPTSITDSNFSTGYNQILTGAVSVTDPVTLQLLRLGNSLLNFQPPGSGNTLTANSLEQIKNNGLLPTSYYPTMTTDLGVSVLDPVNTITGEFYNDTVDVRLNGPMPLDIRRNYGSLNLADGNFSYGWKLGYVPYLVVSADVNQSLIYASEMDGSVIAYRRQTTPNTRWIPLSSDNPQLSNIAGDSTSSITNLLNNRIDMTVASGTNYTLTGADGSIRAFQVRSFPTSGTNGLTRTRPYLQKWQDNRGNYYQFTFGNDPTANDWGQLNRVDSSNGNFVGFSYDAYGHIVQAYTGDGRRLYYKYDDYNDLVQVTLPDASTIGYQYSHKPNTSGTGYYSEHLIIEEDKPQGRVLTNAYVSGTDRRVLLQKSTIGQNFNLITSGSFSYTNTIGTDNTRTGTTVIYTGTDGLHKTKYDYSGGLITTITDALNQQINQTWYLPGDNFTGAYPRSLKSRTDKRGLRTDYQYDPRGNLSLKTLTGDLYGNGNSDVAITSSTYNALNLVLQTTDPVGVTTSYGYDSTFQYLPSLITKSNTSGTISVTKFEYQNVPASSGSGGAFGVLFQETKAFGFPDKAVTTYVNDSHGFIKTVTKPTGTSDPDVVINYAYNLRGEMTSETDALGRMTKYAYDGRGNKIWSERHDETGALVSWHYDYFNQNGEIEWSQGPRYNPNDYLLRQYDGAGRLSQEIKWRSQGSPNGGGVQAVQGIDTAYATTINVYDNFGNLTEVHDPRHNTTIMGYDNIGQMISRSKCSGYVTGSASNIIAPEGFLYEPGGEIKQYTNPLGGVTTKLFTNTGKIKDQKDSVTGVEVQFRYDSIGRITTEIFANGTQRKTVYDDCAHTVKRTIYKSDLSTILATDLSLYDRRGNLISKTDLENNIFTNSYDCLNRIKTAAGPASTGSCAQEIIAHTYGAGDKVHIVTDALGQKTHTQSDAEGRPVFVQVKDKYNTIVRQTNYEYSPDHNSMTVTEGLGSNAISTTTMTDTFGKPVIIKHGDGSFKLMAYDSNGNLVSSQDENNSVTINSYDALNRLSTQTLPGQGSTVGASTTFIYDAAGNLTQRQMPEGQIHWQTYDHASRKQTEYLAGASGSTTRNFSYTYYPAGNAYVGLPQTTTDPLGVTFTTVYDDFMRPQTLTTAGSQAGQSGTTTYGFDNLNRLKSATQSIAGNSTLVQRTYDPYGHIATELVTLNGTALNQFNQTWNGAGKRSSLVSLLAAQGLGAGLATGYAYWPDGLMRQEAVAGGNFYFNYGTNSLLTSRQNPGRIQTITSRDLLGRILTQQNSDSFSESQTWIPRGQRNSYSAQKSGLDWNGAAVWSGSSNYSYNGRGQLYSESDLANNGAYGDFQYRFDNEPVSASLPAGAGLGVRTSAMRRNNPSDYTDNLTGSWLVTGADSFKRPLNEQAFTATNAGVSLQETYDAVGQILTCQLPDGNIQVNTWDAFGRLIKVAERDTSGSNGFNWTAIFDGLGRRLQTNAVPVGAGSPKVPQPANITSYFDPQVEFLELGVSVNGTRTWKVYGPDLSGRYGGLQGIGGLEATIDETTGTINTLVNDVFGNVVGSTPVGSLMASGTSSGNINSILSGTDTGSGNTNPIVAPLMVWNPAQVNSYGVLLGSSPAILGGNATLTQSIMWRSMRLDPTGNINMGGRYYKPSTGRFLSSDPKGHGASMDLYSYCQDPVNDLDPDGRCGKGLVEGWNGTSSANAPNSNAYWTGNMVSSVLTGGVNGLLQGIKNDVAGVGIAGVSVFGGEGAYYGNNAISDWAGWTDTSSLTNSEQQQRNVQVYNASNAAQNAAFALAGAYQAPRITAPQFLPTEIAVGYHATYPDVVPLIEANGFRPGTAPGRLGAGGTYVNNTPNGAVAEFQNHNPGVTPTVLTVEYEPGINASTSVAPKNYVDTLPFYNVDSISAPSVRMPGTTNTNVLNGSLIIIK